MARRTSGTQVFIDYKINGKKREILQKWANRLNSTTGKGIVAKRFIFNQVCAKVTPAEKSVPASEYACKKQQKKIKAALYLAKMAGQYFDEHGGYERGDYFYTTGVDFVNPETAKVAPYCDMGGRGLGLIDVTRRRVYAKSSKWYPKIVSQTYLVGRNEAGTFFAHPVPNASRSVKGALNWMWDNKSENIIQRQGDIALIEGPGPKLPKLPFGHIVKGNFIVHDTHPDLPLPTKGQRVIVAKRAVVVGHGLSGGTRD